MNFNTTKYHCWEPDCRLLIHLLKEKHRYAISPCKEKTDMCWFYLPGGQISSIFYKSPLFFLKKYIKVYQ